VGFGRRDWAVFGAMAAGPMLVGHTGMNYALRYFRATTVNVVALGEPVGASLIAWLVPAIHEVPPVSAVIGGVLVLVGIGLSVSPGEGAGKPAARPRPVNGRVSDSASVDDAESRLQPRQGSGDAR